MDGTFFQVEGIRKLSWIPLFFERGGNYTKLEACLEKKNSFSST